jgi:hypothetical protein
MDVKKVNENIMINMHNSLETGRKLWKGGDQKERIHKTDGKRVISIL